MNQDERARFEAAAELSAAAVQVPRFLKWWFYERRDGITTKDFNDWVAEKSVEFVVEIESEVLSQT